MGLSVAVSPTYTLAGAPFDDLGAQDSGAVKVFDTASGNLLFVLRNPSPNVSDQFGMSVALSGSRVEHRRINPGIAMTATRLEVRIPEQLNDRLEALAAEEGMTKTDLFRRALALYMLTKERQKAGAQLQFAQGNNTETLVSI
jgi:predicted transcriptional regulator